MTKTKSEPNISGKKEKNYSSVVIIKSEPSVSDKKKSEPNISGKKEKNYSSVVGF